MILKHAYSSLAYPNQKHHYATVALALLFAAGTFFAGEVRAQGPSKVAVPPAHIAQATTGLHESSTPVASKVAVGTQHDTRRRLLLSENEKSELQVKNRTEQVPENQRDHRIRSRVISSSPEKQETIPRLNAAKMPPAPPGTDPDSPPVYVSGEHMDGYADGQVVVQGRGQLIRDTTVVQGEELIYNRQTEVATASQNVNINYEGNVFRGEQAQLHVPTSLGYFDQATYQIGLTGAHGQASQIEFTGKDQMTLNDATYTLCEPRADGSFDWVMTADSVELDLEKDEGVAHNAVMRFMDVPILATPWMSFPLSDKRRSGWLVPTFNIDSDNGFTYSQPYYWNIAPNYDATLTPFVMTKRGVGLDAEFRYLQPNFTGGGTGTFLPNDRIRQDGISWNQQQYDYWQQRDPGMFSEMLDVPKDRWGYSVNHRQVITRSMPVLGDSNLELKLNRVSDHNYWRDFPRSGTGALTTRLLNNGGLWRLHNSGVSTFVRVQRWQTLQDLDSYFTPPFDRTQIRSRYDLEDVHGFDLALMGDITKFESKRLDNEVNENSIRSIFQVSASYPIREPGRFVIPKVQLLGRYYDFDADVLLESKNDNPLLANDRMIRHRFISVPTFSVDSGLIFERRASLLGTEYVQTLEPRALYTYTPCRDQSMLPLYDTGAYDYNLATLYFDNPYSGYDRIADVNMMTVGIGTRWQNPQTGVEALNLNIAQRMRFSNQRVTLDNEPITSRYSDVLLSASTELVQNWRFDALIQYDTHENRSQRSLLMARWTPGKYRVMNFGYRMMRESNEQLDFSWQWPLGSPWFGSALPEPTSRGGRWYTVGRINYSLRNKEMIDGIIGFEHQSCCWIGRVVAERVSTGRTETNTKISLQLEFTGLSRVGVNPLKILQENINHYQIIRNERVVSPIDFELYE